MIEGLKVTVDGEELRRLCEDRARHHRERAATYRDQIDNMKAAKVEGMQYSGGDPISALETRKTQHENDANEMQFVAEHIDINEDYLLDREALRRIGVVSGNY